MNDSERILEDVLSQKGGKPMHELTPQFLEGILKVLVNISKQLDKKAEAERVPDHLKRPIKSNSR